MLGVVDVFYHYGMFVGKQSMPITLLFCFLLSFLLSSSDPPLSACWNSGDSDSDPSLAYCATPPSGLDGVVMTVTRVVAILSLYSQLQAIHRIGLRTILYFSLLLTLISSVLFVTLASYVFAPLHVSIFDMLPFFLLLLDVPKTVSLGQSVFTAHPSSRYVYRISLASAMQRLAPAHTLNFVVSVLLLAMGLILDLKYVKLVCVLSITCEVSLYICFMTIYPALLVLFSEVCLYSAKPASKHREFVIDCADIDCSFLSCEPNSVLLIVKAMISLGSLIVHVLVYFLNPTTCAYSLCKTTNTHHVVSIDLHDLADRETIELIYGYSVEREPLILFILLMSLIMKFVISKNFESSVSSETSPTQINAALDKETELRTPVKDSVDGFATCLEGAAFTRSVSWKSGGTMDNVRSFAECCEIWDNEGADSLSDLELVLLVKARKLQAYSLETMMDKLRAVAVRRELISQLSSNPAVLSLPYEHLDYDELRGACCENVIGYAQIPVGVAGPLTVNGQPFFVPMATTEGALVASTNRGCKALRDGVNVVVKDSGMTRAPAVEFPSIAQANVFCDWFANLNNLDLLRREVESESRHTKLISVTPTQEGRHVFLRFQATTGDAMGMNMLSKGVERCLIYLQCEFPSMKIITISGNMCTDKKPSAINWILGRGKKVIAEAEVSKQDVQSVLKTNVPDLVELNKVKNLIGSQMAGSIGGCNAHAANIVTAVFIATGQDPAQVVESSNCLTNVEVTEEGNLRITCTLPCLEVGTLGGGTGLPAQKAALKMLNVQGSTCEEMSSENNVLSNAQQLAAIIGATVVAGELSLLASLQSGDLVRSHLRLNRSAPSNVRGDQNSC